MAVNQRKDSKSVKVSVGFETAIAATGFGKFNLLLLLICFPVLWTVQFEATLASYIIPAAACDLELTPTQKSFLNSVSIMGMITSGFIWGVLLDTLGRRRIILTGFLINIFVVIGQSLSQNIYFLSAFKFCGGALTGGLYVATNTYLQEFHSTLYRGKIQMIYGMTYCISNLLIPLICSAILPLQFHIQLYFMEFKAWNLLILVSSTSSIIAYICFNFFPESPKFLMSMGDNEQALKVFKSVYRFNSGKSEDTYPYEYLMQEFVHKKETPASKISILKFFKTVWDQVTPLFGKQYRMTLFLVCVIQANFLMAMCILTYYMPQIFQATHEYQIAHNGTSPDLCSVLDLLRVPAPAEDEEYICTVNLDNNFSVYFSSVITAIVALIFYMTIGLIINFVGRKRLLIVLGLASAICGSCLYVSPHPTITLALSSLYLAQAGLCYDIFVTVVMVLFPTKLRAMSYCTCLLVGRAMTVVGNMLFVYFVEMGCALPFLSLGSIMLVPVGFEAAMAATGFGKFNLLLLLVCVPVAWTTQFESTLASYIIPAAACDLELTPAQKSFLNSVSLMGMITSGFIWGVLLDILGRKRIVLTGFMTQIFMVIGQSLSQNIYFLSTFKFFGGAVTGGLYVATNTYLMEFHSTQYRGKIQMVYGMTYCISNLVIPLICSAILPLQFHIQLYFMEFKAWNLLILVSSSTSVIAYICFHFFPESPKFLMSMGDNEQALKVFKSVYRLNTGKLEETYPYEYLTEEVTNEKETPASKTSIIKFFKIVWEQVTPLFDKKYRMTLFLVCVVQASFQMAINILRFYMPQIFQATHEYQVTHNGTSPDLCSVLDLLRVPAPMEDEEYVCTVNLENNFTVYLSSVITAIVALICYMTIGIIINFVGRQRLMTVLGITAGIFGSCLYVSPNPTITLALSSLYLALSALCYDINVTIVMVLFPTKMRAMSYSTCLLVGRAMTVVGNMVFVYFVEFDCALPFISLGGVMLVGVIISCLVPNTEKIEMK